MKVYVKVFATLVQSLSAAVLARHAEEIRSGSRFEVKLPENSTLADLVDYLGLPKGEVKVTFVNGRARDFDHPLSPGDQVGIFPPIGGG